MPESIIFESANGKAVSTDSGGIAIRNFDHEHGQPACIRFAIDLATELQRVQEEMARPRNPPMSTSDDKKEYRRANEMLEGWVESEVGTHYLVPVAEFEALRAKPPATELAERLRKVAKGEMVIGGSVKAELDSADALDAQAAQLAELRTENERLSQLLGGGVDPFFGRDNLSKKECWELNLCHICGFTIIGQAADIGPDECAHAACRELAAAVARAEQAERERDVACGLLIEADYFVTVGSLENRIRDFLFSRTAPPAGTPAAESEAGD